MRYQEGERIADCSSLWKGPLDLDGLGVDSAFRSASDGAGGNPGGKSRSPASVAEAGERPGIGLALPCQKDTELPLE